MTAVLADAVTVADLLKQLGGIPASRVRLRPTPGTATEKDVTRVNDHENCLCELVDGVLVEKTVGAYEARLASMIGYSIERFLDDHDLGITMGADATLRLMPGLVRVPDVSYVSWEKLPNRIFPAAAIPALIPDLAIEVLSKGNTKNEMQRKLREYFECGVKQVWFVFPKTQTARVFASPGRSTLIKENQALSGGDILPGFTLPLRKLFGRAGKRNDN